MATADLFEKIIEYTDAPDDEGHIRIFIDCNPSIPNRTKAIFGEGESPVPFIADSAAKLESMGAELLLLPCNTSHYYFDEIKAQCRVPLLNMVEITSEQAARRGAKRAAILATDGTVKTGVYQKALEAAGIEALIPDGKSQRDVMKIIYDGVKAGNRSFDPSGFMDTVAMLRGRGADTFILACTELPIALRMYGLSVPGALDSTDALARAAVTQAGYKLRCDGK